MAVNPGAYPIDPMTPVGSLRLALMDTDFEPLEPPVTGQVSYTNFSDAELQALLIQGGGNETRAMGYALLRKADAAAAEAVSVRTQDLSADLSRKAEQYRLLAQVYFGRADADDAASGTDEAFEIVPTGSYGPTHWPEAAAYPFWR